MTMIQAEAEAGLTKRPAPPSLPSSSPVAPVGIPPLQGESFTFGGQQEKTAKDVSDWLRGIRQGTEKRQVFRLFGFAGTGKTTLARHLAAGVDGDVCFAAFTGKAALMMQQSGCTGASTIHSLLYTARINEDGSVQFKLNCQGPAAKAALIIIDECSMVDEKIGRDLLSFGVPILVLGDPAQLPPVKGSGFFTSGAKPDAMLTEIHRQARDNPIIRIATDVREGRGLCHGTFGSVEIGKPGERSVEDVLKADQIIVGRNATRNAFNRRIRAHLGHSSPLPALEDRLVCLRNDMFAGILNGGLFKVAGHRPARAHNRIGLDVLSEDFPDRGTIPVQVRREFFDGDPGALQWRDLMDTQQFDYGYALTGHKSQGSQWKHVIAYDESASFGRNGRRWLYTVITRASDRLTLIR